MSSRPASSRPVDPRALIQVNSNRGAAGIGADAEL
jgi:hypothetical protein